MGYEREVIEYDYINSFVRTMQMQQLLWTHLENGHDMAMEIILPMKAKVREFKGGGYVMFLVQIQKDGGDGLMNKGDHVLFQMPIRTWERAMLSIPMKVKKLWTQLGNDNIYFEGERVNKSLLIIKNVERRQSTAEQLAKAELAYKG